ncbi:MAG TPA: SWIM zinc finger family protein [Trebonia sp.]|nr:SWIM zinc finger family protein [Trebonia sp.]
MSTVAGETAPHAPSGARWTTEAVLALAPDDSSRKAATVLARPATWSDAGTTPDLLWGLCLGSASKPYQIVVEISGPAYRCSCPSRKFPCKHALGLLLAWANGEVPDRPEPSDYAVAWASERRARAERAAARAVPRGGPAAGDATPADAAEARRRDEAAVARRAQRAERVASGLAELQEWLRDQVRIGLPASVGAGRPGGGSGADGGRHADLMAARMNDAMATGVGSALRDLSVVPLSGEGWPDRLLAGYAQLHLLARAHERLDELPAGLAATVRSRIGYTTGRQEVLAQPAVPDRWLVTGVRDSPEATVPTRRVWLRGRSCQRSALLLAFAVNGAWSDPDIALLPLGSEIDADVHYYPADPPQRAQLGQRRTAPAAGTQAPEPGDVDGLLAQWAAGLAADPWLTTWPALLTGTPVAPAVTLAPGGDDLPPAPRGESWHLVDPAGTAIPLRYSESLWTLLAVSGGNPVTVAGEWTPDGLTALTVWHDRQAVAL